VSAEPAPDPLLDCLSDGVLVLDEERVVRANLAAAELLGRSPARLCGASLTELLGDDAAVVVARVIEGAASCTARGVRLLPGTQRVRLTGTPGPRQGLVVLSLRTEEGADPAVAAAFRRRLSWLDSLAAGVAHEIRNPLGGIRGAAQLLRRGGDREAFDELTELIIQDVDRIDYQVERLMELTRPRPLRPQPVLLHELLHREVERLAARPDAAVAWEVAIDPSLPPIEADAERLQEAFGNLLRNACEAAESRVVVRVGVDRAGRLVDPVVDRGPTLRVDIEDDGAGIPDDQLEDLFAPFATTKAAGSGLGLFLARLAVEDHGGRLTVDPRPGQGAAFSVLLTERLPPRDEHALEAAS